MEESRFLQRLRHRGRGLVVVIVLLAMMLVAVPGPARAASSGHISLMPFGPFHADGYPFTTWGASISCTPTTGCTGALGFDFPLFVRGPWSVLGTVSGSYACPSSTDATECSVHVSSGTLFDCTILAPIDPTPGISNDVSISCTAPKGGGTGLASVTVQT